MILASFANISHLIGACSAVSCSCIDCRNISSAAITSVITSVSAVATVSIVSTIYTISCVSVMSSTSIVPAIPRVSPVGFPSVRVSVASILSSVPFSVVISAVPTIWTSTTLSLASTVAHLFPVLQSMAIEG